MKEVGRSAVQVGAVFVALAALQVVGPSSPYSFGDVLWALGIVVGVGVLAGSLLLLFRQRGSE